MKKLSLRYHAVSELAVIKELSNNDAVLFRQLFHNSHGFVFNELLCLLEYDRLQIFQLLLVIQLYLLDLFVAEALIFLNCSVILNFF